LLIGLPESPELVAWCTMTVAVLMGIWWVTKAFVDPGDGALAVGVILAAQHRQCQGRCGGLRAFFGVPLHGQLS